jgi:hypothetical protein
MGSCEDVIEPSGSIQCQDCRDRLRRCWAVKSDTAHWNCKAKAILRLELQQNQGTGSETGTNLLAAKFHIDVMTGIVAYVVAGAGTRNSARARMASDVKWCDVFFSSLSLTDIN